MVNIPFSGHVNPTLPLAKEFVRRGHKVSYILTKEWKKEIETKLNKSHISANLLREKVELLLEDEEVKQNVIRMSKMMRLSGGVKKAADCIEGYLEKK